MKIIPVAAAIIEKEGKILIAKRNSSKQQAGKWEFPGGKIEANESPEECLRRELQEEFSIKVEVGLFIGENVCHYKDISIRLLAYHVKHISGEFRLIDHDELQWVMITDLLSYDMAEADVPIINLLSNGIN